MTTTVRRLLLVFALVGLGSAGYSLFIHYQLTHQPGYVSACDISTVWSCTNAYLSRFGAVAGVPTALLGLLWFAFVFLLVAVGARSGSPMADSTGAYLFAMSTVALAAILYLGYAAFFILRAICLFCLITYVAVIGLFIVSGLSTGIPMKTLPRRLFQDLRAATARPAWLVSFLLFLAAAGLSIALAPGVFAGGTAEAAVAPAGQTPAPAGSTQPDLVQWLDAQPRLTIPVSTGGAKVLVVKFTDFQCPGCAASHVAEKPIYARLESEFPGQIRLVIKHFPLERECNPVMAYDMHVASCEAAAAIVMARAKGREGVLADWFVQNHQMLSPALVKQAARTTGLIDDFESQYARALEEVKTDVGLGRLLGVRQTPTSFMNGIKLEGFPPQYLDAALRHELAKAGGGK
jgi:uncharacterized membrane protein/protein-disulfide isomerase